MNTFSSRINLTLTWASSVLGFMAIGVALTTFFLTTPAEQIFATAKIAEVKRLGRTQSGEDAAILNLKIDCDFSKVWNWNVKQLFVYVTAEYKTKRNILNQIVLWDYVITDKEYSIIKFDNLPNKYPLIDQGHNLRGKPINITVSWDIMPHSEKYHNLKPYDKWHLPQVIVSLIHAIISTQGSIRYVSKFPINFQFYLTKMVPDKTVRVDDMLLFYLEIAIGYFIYDLVVYLFDIKHVTKLQIFHHLLAIINYITGVLFYVGTFGMICLQTNEISTPSLHIRGIMKLFGYSNNIFYKMNEIIFVLLFFFNRIIWNIFVWSAVQTSAIVRQEDFSKINKYFQQTCITLH
eukprot:gene4782-8368_t